MAQDDPTSAADDDLGLHLLLHGGRREPLARVLDAAAERVDLGLAALAQVGRGHAVEPGRELGDRDGAQRAQDGAQLLARAGRSTARAFMFRASWWLWYRS